MDDRPTTGDRTTVCSCCGLRGARFHVEPLDTPFPLGRLRRNGGAVAICPRCDLHGTALPGWTTEFAEDLDG